MKRIQCASEGSRSYSIQKFSCIFHLLFYIITHCAQGNTTVCNWDTDENQTHFTESLKVHKLSISIYSVAVILFVLLDVHVRLLGYFCIRLLGFFCSSGPTVLYFLLSLFPVKSILCVVLFFQWQTFILPLNTPFKSFFLSIKATRNNDETLRFALCEFLEQQ